MAEETKEAPKTNKQDLSKFDALAREYCSAPSPEARAKVIAENPDLMKSGILARRRLEREALSLGGSILNRADENQVGGALHFGGVLGGLGILGVGIYKGVMWGWHYFRPV